MPSTQSDSPRLQVAIVADKDVPGLYNLYFSDGRQFDDLTTGQVSDVLRREGMDPAQIWAMPLG